VKERERERERGGEEEQREARAEIPIFVVSRAFNEISQPLTITVTDNN